MEIDTGKLFKYFNTEFATFDQYQVDLEQVSVVTGVLKQDAYLVYVRDHYGVILSRDDPDPDVFSKWSTIVIDDKKFSWLMLKI